MYRTNQNPDPASRGDSSCHGGGSLAALVGSLAIIFRLTSRPTTKTILPGPAKCPVTYGRFPPYSFTQLFLTTLFKVDMPLSPQTQFKAGIALPQGVPHSAVAYTTYDFLKRAFSGLAAVTEKCR